MKHTDKNTLLQTWQRGDNPKVAREMERLFNVKVTKWAVRLWANGETTQSKLDRFYLEAAQSVQKGRALSAVEEVG